MKLTQKHLATYLQPGETVLVMGLEREELCVQAARSVGVKGQVLGVEPEAERLASARTWDLATGQDDHSGVQKALLLHGGAPLTLRRVALHDLALDVEQVETYLREAPITSLADLARFEAYCGELRRSHPVVENDSVDVILCENVLSRVLSEGSGTPVSFFAETYRVLKRGGRLLLVDALADEDVPARLRREGRAPGPLREAALLRAMEEVPYYGLKIVELGPAAVAFVEDIEFREALIVARKGKEGVCLERNQAVIYKGPWQSVTDDDGHTLPRGVRIAVCDKTYHLYARPPYREDVILIDPVEEVPLEEAKPFDCSRDVERPAWETKGRVALSRDPLVTVAHKRPEPPADKGDAQEGVGLGYLVHAEWRSATGALERHVKIAPRFAACYETAQEALRASQSLFPDASRHRVEARPVEELLARQPRGRRPSGPIDKERA